jgi:DNA-binding GntR family transcriptional regulator
MPTMRRAQLKNGQAGGTAHARTKTLRGTAAVDERIYESVFDAVMSHRLPPGTKLSEISLCNLFHVSRTTVRKALQRLAYEHIVLLRPNRGATIAQPSPQETREIFAARRVIEQAVVPLVVARATRTELAHLRRHVREEHVALERGDRSRWIRLTGQFHLELAAVAGNTVLAAFLSELVSRCSLIIAIYDISGAEACGDGDHEDLIDAIGHGDTQQALRLMDSHLQQIEARLKLEDRATEVDLASILAPA